MKPENNRSRVYLYGALIAAQFCLYYKEPVFILIGSFAASRLILCILVDENKAFMQARNFPAFLKTHYVDFGLTIQSIIFLILYKLEVASHVTSRYQANSNESPFITFLSYIKNDFLLAIFIAAIILKISYSLFFRKYPNAIWDSLGLGALLYLLAFIRLNMYTSYYIAPVDFIAVLYLSQLAYHIYVQQKPSRARVRRVIYLSIAVFMTFIFINQNLQKSATSILERKTRISGQIQLMSGIKKYSESSNLNLVALFFPLPINAYFLADFATILEYKGFDLYYEEGEFLPIKNRDVESSAIELPMQVTTFMLKSPLVFEHNHCVPWFSINCFQSMKPSSEDLIVILPGVSGTQEAMDLKAESKILFSYQQEANFSMIEKILLAISRQDFSYMDVYLLQKL